MPKKGQRLSRKTNRHSYNVQASKREDYYKFCRDSIRNSPSNTASRRRGTRRKNSNGKNINVSMTDEQAVLLLKAILALFIIVFVATVIINLF